MSNLLQRLRNIWRLSEYEVPDVGVPPSTYPPGSKIAQSLVKPAQIIKMKRPLDDFPKE